MLLLTRKPEQSVHIGDRVTITVSEVRGHQVKLAIHAPEDVSILREELEPWPHRPARAERDDRLQGGT